MPKPDKQIIIDAIIKEIEPSIGWVQDYLDYQSVYKITPPERCNVVNPYGYYVYALINPVDGKIFYIGKGIGGRAASHLKLLKNDTNKSKRQFIINLYNAGKVPIIWILQQNMEECAALGLEAILINTIPGLTNTASPAIKNDNEFLLSQKSKFIGEYVPSVVIPCKTVPMEHAIDEMITIICNGWLFVKETWTYIYQMEIYCFEKIIHLLPDHLRKEVLTKKYQKLAQQRKWA